MTEERGREGDEEESGRESRVRRGEGVEDWKAAGRTDEPGRGVTEGDSVSVSVEVDEV